MQSDVWKLLHEGGLGSIDFLHIDFLHIFLQNQRHSSTFNGISASYWTESYAQILRFRDVFEEIKQKVSDIFHRGYFPFTALNTFKLDLQLEHGADYTYIAGDMAKCPDLKFCYMKVRIGFLV